MFPNVYNRLIMRIVGDFDNERMFPIALFLYPFCALYGRKGQPSAAGGQQPALQTEILCRTLIAAQIPSFCFSGV